MTKATDLKTIPIFETDADAEFFVDEADLTEYDLSGFKPMRFEFEKKDAAQDIRPDIARP